jgi:NADPH:quinone reductase-like Zn-dependent oxidoreductase
MKTAVYQAYGPPQVLHIVESEKPEPEENELLIRVKARSVNYGDLFARQGIPRERFNMPGFLYLPVKLVFGAKKPKIKVLGSEYSGIVESVGAKVSRFKAGDEVYGYLGQNMGANAEYLTVKETGTLELKPRNLSFEEAATVPYGTMTAYSLLQKREIRLGQEVLIIGASGSIGAAALQLCKMKGARVSAVAGTPRMEYAFSLGADRVIDYRKEDFTQDGMTYDLIMDIIGKSSFSAVKNSLKGNGVYFCVSFKTRELLQMLMNTFRGGRRVLCALSSESAENLAAVGTLIEEGKLTVRVDRSFPLDRIAEAHAYAESDERKGSVVVSSP